VFIFLPPRFNDGSGRVWKLKMVNQGPKQAVHELHRALAAQLSEMGFENCASDYAVFVGKVGT